MITMKPQCEYPARIVSSKDREVAELADTPQHPGLLVRQSTGLVREVGAGDTLLYNLLQIGILVAAPLVLTQSLTNYSGANPVVATLLTGLAVAPFALTYVLFALIMPRSGGDYVFVGRSLHPSLGFIANWMIIINGGIFIGWTAKNTFAWGFSTLAAVLGQATGNQTWSDLSADLARPAVSFSLGILLILVLSLVLSRNIRVFMTMQRGLFFIMFLGFLLISFVFLTNDSGSWARTIGEMTGQPGATASSFVDQAQAAGYTNPSGFNFGNTIQLLVWPWFGLAYMFYSTYFAGEIKNVRRSIPLGVLGALLVGTLGMAFLIAVAQNSIGSEELGAISYLSDSGSISIPVGLDFIGLPAIASGNTLVALLIALALPAQIIMFQAGIMLYCTRGVFAWSFDRIFPEKFAEVSPRSRTAIWPVVFFAVIGAVSVWIYSFTTRLDTLSTQAGLAFGFLFVMIAGVLFPYRRKSLYQASGFKWQLAGVPLLTVTGVLGAASLIFLMTLFLSDPLAGGLPNYFSAGMEIMILALGVLVYTVAYMVRKRQGIDLNDLYEEIPPE